MKLDLYANATESTVLEKKKKKPILGFFSAQEETI